MYCEEGTEVLFSDYGTAQLINGICTVTIDPRFSFTVNTSLDYKVFLQPEGDCKGLFVENKSANTFIVKELQQGVSSISFSYKIIAKRKGFENLRMPTEQDNNAANNLYQQNVWSAVYQEREAQQKPSPQRVQNLLQQAPTPISNTNINSPTIQKPNANFTPTSSEVPPLTETPVEEKQD